MKKAFLLLLAPLLIAACKQPETKTAATIATPDYPYKIKQPDNWLMDTSHTNTMAALKCLKAFETNDSVTAKAIFADTLEFKFDGGKFKGTYSQLGKIMAPMMADMKDMKIDMKDWESVVSKDGKEQWVTLWYTQKWKTSKGVIDSVALINDMQFKAGRISKLNEYDMHYKMPAK
jgi:hypothetical protein